jgi:hypothetical protein
MTGLLLILLCLLTLRALGRPGAERQLRWPAPVPWAAPVHRLADDVLRGVRTLSRLDAARRDRLGRPWA